MADTVFSNGVTLTDSDWFNDTNRIVYTILADSVDAAAAREALAAAASGANNDITSLTGLTTPLSVAQGGTGVAAQTGNVSAIRGFTYANNSGDAVNDLDIAAGGAMDATGARWITVAALTKQLDAAWAVGSAAGGLDTGSVGNSDYYIHAIARSDTGVTDILYSLSSTAPTMPANYDFRRLIGWFKRVAGANVLFDTYETEGGGIEMNWRAPTLDVNLANTLTTSRRTDAVKVPLNLSVLAHLIVTTFDAVQGVISWLTCPDTTDAAPSTTAAPLFNLAATPDAFTSTELWVRTSATGRVACRSNLATVDLYAIVTTGFRWSRR